MKILRFFVMFITIQDFSGIYKEQAFMQKLRETAICQKNKNNPQQNIQWLDCTKVAGTDCYCDDEAVAEINKLIDENVYNAGPTTTPAIHFFDNGNYHYMSKLWTDRITEPFDLVVFDHHPDMQPPRFGDILSCGGWVKKVLEENKFVQNIILIGVADNLVEEVLDERRKTKDDREKVGHWESTNLTIVRESELDAFASNLSSFVSTLSSNIYFTIDKDALSPAFAATNWDQGSLTLDMFKEIFTSLAQGRKILGVDICGERAQEFSPIENGAQTAQEADELNNKLNQELVEFLVGSWK